MLRSPGTPAVVAMVVAVALAGCAAGGQEADAPAAATSSASPLPAVSAGTLAGEGTAGEATSQAFGDIPIQSSDPQDQPQAAPVDEPASVTVPSLDIAMTVDAVGVERDGTMEIPQDADVAGWYKFGPAPLEPGNTVMAAHVDDPDGLGPFGRLPQIAVGAGVTVTTASGLTITYEVTEVEQTDKRDVDLAAVFANSGDSQVVLVTCGGRWDAGRGHYDDNVIVTAVRTGTDGASAGEDAVP
ncbi:class F sortase [Demequina sp. B12]|uniref:class F sortase n=1 Tax=Demequina sp. B12 TaxID=2992757 RepID=UPI00237C21AB|nr:class F sortase [Demequina sp. B12]MDE0572311.1 class F sortase [Demequina sp. B12]